MCLKSCMWLGSGRESEKQSGAIRGALFGRDGAIRPPPRRHSCFTTPVALRKIGKFNGGGSKKFAAVNSGRSVHSTPLGTIFSFGISQDSLILRPITGARLPPVIPSHPPYLV